MITKRQVEELASHFSIDQTTIFREYLQLQFLNYFYQQKEAEEVFFKGGTAIHLVLNSPRFSEDLDFSTKFSKRGIIKIVKKTEKEIGRELPGLRIALLYQGKRSVRFRLKYSAGDFKYPFIIRLDFTEKDKALKKTASSPLVTRFPISLFPIVNHFRPEEILAEKVRALLTRGKGRDVFDLWFLLEKGVNFDTGLVNKKLKVVGKRFDRQTLIKKITGFSQKRLTKDLNKFLPQPQRKLTETLKERLTLKVMNLALD